jgi:trk system potassium uptake protein TrkA
MNIVVVGCGRVGAELAFRLFQKGHTVTVVDPDPAAFKNLHPDFRGRAIEGEIMNDDILRRSGVDRAEGVAAVTTSDSLNAVVGHIARSLYNVPYVVVRNYDPHRRSLIEAFGLQVVASSSWGAQRIEEMLYHSEMRTVFSAGNGEVEIYEFTIPEAWEGRTLQELLCNQGCSPAALTRAGRAMLPTPETSLEEGDIILVSATLDGIESLRRRLTELQEA